MKLFNRILATLALLALLPAVQAQVPREYLLGPGDIIRITVFQNPDLTTEARVSEANAVTFPLVGSLIVGGLTVPAAEQRIAKALADGGFVRLPQVNVLPVQVRGSQVAVLGQVSKPGRFPLETFNTRLSDMIAMAGGIAGTGADVVIITGIRGGKAFRKEVDIAEMYLHNTTDDDILLAGGDTLYVHRAPVFYIYGEVQRAGVYRLERSMTLIQALATGGGLTPRGTQRGIAVHRRDAAGNIQTLKPGLSDTLQADDVVYVQESLF
ncbi:MAG: polysaccharide export protein EpsE [Candidatus Dactylopiibacterium carminicum]|uniref:Polysaccharide export protein EpsE n=1 Tax=Candidatus Dactylopiibacterium carminicum TaxID=857335 RepID=A0A272EQG1_9RHOO|nr:polysaccharide export protein EpsE [Candidatus Dactylopiibacterium carminicum]KAF7598255.1 polysaccharide export protein EpsE [Candidatus Dactylopiibacterium carminicum]PAS91950.1 MAG: polysaccharide export protein EpsE [Candidatus Dactylopiibacterium carminicum]PAS94992.1 MAG: polysaccharide export protein EpsE [Candidatus Dactylopiibacterium carminicum]PAS97138.1 MAG: polysaccharide export protein EpsE [Candidatus Dactylopiibacterium carminicum]